MRDEPRGKAPGPADLDGGPAFPWQRFSVDGRWLPGISIRDYFAALAMQGMLDMQTPGGTDWNPQRDALGAYEVADAMLTARTKANEVRP